MSLLRVGAGGWAYFLVPDEGSLRAYSRGFDFVEVNTTYYVFQNLRTLTGWKRIAPSGFEFSVRCNRKLVDQYCADKPVDNEKREMFLASVERTCKILGANVLTILLNDSGARTVTGLARFFSDFHSKGTRIAVEVRGSAPTEELLETLAKNDGIHCVDISRGEEPLIDSGILYTRLFGKGEDNIYEFDDQELGQIAAKASSPRFEKSILAFHGVRMYRDAARLKTFLATGKFQKLSNYTGLDALEKVLKEDATFPLTKSQLIATQGWKLFDLTSDRRARAEELLRKLPEATFLSAGMVKDWLQRVTGQLSSRQR
jgi:uncharacterized protein YecE (DUF72 family)